MHYEGYAIITGAARGIGFEFARALAQAGNNLVLLDRDGQALIDSATQLSNLYSVNVHTIEKNLTDPNAALEIKNELDEKSISVGLIVHNAGCAYIGLFDELPLEKHLRVLDLMCTFVVKLTHAFLPDMIRRGKGGLVFVSSYAAHQEGYPLDSIYGASKAFLHNFSNALYVENKNRGIDVVCTCPGATDTKIMEKVKEKNPDISMMKPSYVARKTLASLGVRFHVTPQSWREKIQLRFMSLLPYKIYNILSRAIYSKMFKIKI